MTRLLEIWILAGAAVIGYLCFVGWEDHDRPTVTSEPEASVTEARGHQAVGHRKCDVAKPLECFKQGVGK